MPDKPIIIYISKKSGIKIKVEEAEVKEVDNEKLPGKGG